ncbi:unnamed protein product [Hymenolepis diminuta]|uniref:Uncharacterized protein n=1 Tax=Hymenolepis diminuta TaxID=6216 RepID=A0A564ZBW4_HYMDI|nr:unnamed protein product [Hymenolepis diminuta]
MHICIHILVHPYPSDSIKLSLFTTHASAPSPPPPSISPSVTRLFQTRCGFLEHILV